MCMACGHKYPGPTQRSRPVRLGGRYRIKPLRRPLTQQPAQPIVPVTPPVIEGNATGVVEIKKEI